MYRWLLPPKLIIASLLWLDYFLTPSPFTHFGINGGDHHIEGQFQMKRGRYWDYICVEEQSLSSIHAYFSGILWKFLRKVYSLFMCTYLIFLIFSRTIFRIMRGFTFYHTHMHWCQTIYLLAGRSLNVDDRMI